MARGTAHVCISTPRQDLEALAGEVAHLLDQTDEALGPYAEDIAEAYEGVRAVVGHVPAPDRARSTP